MIKKLFEALLSDYRWFRRRTGGEWYYVSESSTSGFSSDIIGWVRKINDQMTVLKTEHYPARK